MPPVPTVNVLAEEHDFCLEVAGRLIFEKRYPLHRNLIALYGTMLELSGAMIVAERNNTGIAIRALFRPFLETFVEITNLAADPAYGENMEIAHLTEWNKSLRSARDGNPFLATVGQLPDLDEQIERNAARVKELEDNGVKKLTVFERFQRARMENEYRSIYNQLSADAHANVRALVDRHFELNEAGDDFEVVIYKNYAGEFDHIYFDCAKLLLLAGQRLCRAIDSDIENVFQQKLEIHNARQGGI